MDIIFKSLLSAVVTAVILLIAKFSGARLAGAIGGLPIVFAISYIIITAANRSASKNFLVGGVFGALAAIFFSVILILFNTLSARTHWLNFIIAYALCFLMAFGMAYFSTPRS